MSFFKKKRKKTYWYKEYNSNKRIRSIKKKVNQTNKNINYGYYIGGNYKQDNNKPVNIGINDVKSKFTKKYDCETKEEVIEIDNLQEKYYEAKMTHISRKNKISEFEIKELIDFDKQGNLVSVKKNGKLNYRDIKKIVKFAIQDMYYFEHKKYDALTIPMDPLYYKTIKEGGRFLINERFHPTGLIDKNGDPVLPSTFQEKLARYVIKSMRYMHPYPHEDTTIKPRKVYIYKTDIRTIDRTFLGNPLDLTKNKANNFKPCMDLIAKCIKNAENNNKNAVIALPVSLIHAGHAVLFTCCYDREKNKISIRVFNTNGMPQGFKKYGKPLFKVFKKLLPYYINHSVKLEAKYCDLNNQRGPRCMQYSEEEAKNVVKKNSIGITNGNEVIQGALQRAGEYELCNKLGVKVGINDTETKDISDLIESEMKRDVMAVSKDEYKKTLKNKISFNNKKDYTYNNYKITRA